MAELNEHIERIYALTDRAKAKWGTCAQLVKTCEEMAELTVQLCKYLNGSPNTRDAIVDEIADATIMVIQLRALFSADREVDARIQYKLDRLEKALNR